MDAQNYELLEGSSPENLFQNGNIVRCCVQLPYLETEFELRLGDIIVSKTGWAFNATIVPPDHGHAALEIIGGLTRVGGIYHPPQGTKRARIEFWKMPV